jgi:hypothetical protein
MGQERPQAVVGARQPAAHGAGRHAKSAGDLLVRQAGEVAQRHHDAMLFRQARHGAVNVGAGVVARRVGDQLGGEGDGARAAALGDGEVVGDAVQPTHQALGLPQRRQLFPGAAEGFLGQFLRVVAPPRQAVDVADERRAVSPHELHEGSNVALPGPTGDLTIGQTHGTHPRDWYQDAAGACSLPTGHGFV